MEDRDDVTVGWTGPVPAEAVPVLKPEIVEELLTRLARGEKVKRLAAEYGVDRKTIRVWRARGRYQPRAPRPRKSMLDPHATWLTGRAEGTVIARHRSVGRHQVVLEPAHYAGLLRPRGSLAPAGGPPRFDPGYPSTTDVAVRDLGIHAALAEEAPV